MKNQISVIGFGNFGQLMAKHLIQAGFGVWAADALDKSAEAEEIGARFVSLEEACKSKIIVLAVPMEDLEETLHKIKDRLQSGALVLDVCSLKMFACDLMNRILPADVEVIGTHPLFGPQSAPNSINGMKIALVNVRAKKKIFESVEKFCENLGLKVIITNAKEHDKQMAHSQALSHFIGQVLKGSGAEKVEMSSQTFDRLMSLVDITKNDTSALFNNMQTMNPFAKEARDNFVKQAEKLNAELNKSLNNLERAE